MRRLPLNLNNPDNIIGIFNRYLDMEDTDLGLLASLVETFIQKLSNGFSFDTLLAAVNSIIDTEYITIITLATDIWIESIEIDGPTPSKYFALTKQNLIEGLGNISVSETTLERILSVLQDPHRPFTYNQLSQMLLPVLNNQIQPSGVIIMSLIWMMGTTQPQSPLPQSRSPQVQQPQAPLPQAPLPQSRSAQAQSPMPQWQMQQWEELPLPEEAPDLRQRIQEQLQKQDRERELYVANSPAEDRENYYSQIFGPGYSSWTFFDAIMQDDTTVKEYISDSPDNIIFVIVGAPPVLFASNRSQIRNNTALYDCDDHRKKYISLTNIGYHGVGVANYSAVKTAVLNSNYQLFALRLGGNTNRLISHNILFLGDNMVSGFHCQEGTQMPYYQIYIPPL